MTDTNAGVPTWGVNETDAPEGTPVADRPTAWTLPPSGTTVTTVCVPEPATMESEARERVRWNRKD